MNQGIQYYQSNDPTGNVIAATPINGYSTLTIPAYWRAMAFIADNMSSFPRSVYKGDAAAVHPLNRILERRPNGYQNPSQFWATLFFHAAHQGNGYAEIKRSATPGGAVTLHNLPFGDVMPFRFDRGDGAGMLQYYMIGRGPNARFLAGVDAIHLSGLSFDGMCGIDVVQMMEETFQRAKCLDRFMTRYLVKGTIVRGAIEIPTAVSDERLKEIVSILRTHFGGVEADRDVLVLTDGAKLNNATLTPSDGQVIQQAAYSTKQISQITGVPPEFLFELSEAKYNASVEQAGQNVVRYCFRPWIERAEDELTLKLLSDKEMDQGFSIHIDPDALLRGDSAAVSAQTVNETRAGLRTGNEGRARLGLPSHDGPGANDLKTSGDTNPQGAPPAPKPSPPEAKP